MWFDIFYGWRKWRDQRKIWFLLVVSVCVFCSLIGFGSNVMSTLYKDRPTWVEHDLPIITLANKDLNGTIQPTTIFDIELLHSLDVIDLTSSFTTHKGTITINSEEVNNLTIAFYSQSLIDVLGMPNPFGHEAWIEKRAILSEELYRDYVQLDSYGTQFLYYNDQRIPIAGKAQVSMRRLGNMRVDLWLPDSILHNDVPDMFRENPATYLNTKGDRFGFARLKARASIEQLQQEYSQIKKQSVRPLGGFEDSYFSPWVIDGLELNPQSRESIHKQILILLILTICFGVIIYSGVISVFMQQRVARQQEMSIKISLGASWSQIAIQLLRESTIAITLVVLLSSFLVILLANYIGEIPAYKSYFNYGIEPNILAYIAATLLSVIFYLLCSILPMLSTAFPRLNRGRNGQVTKQQLAISRTLTMGQLISILIVLILTFALSYHEWKKYKAIELPQSLYSVNPTIKGRITTALTAEQRNGDWTLLNEAVALSSKSYTDLGPQILRYSAPGQSVLSKPVNSLYISPNFFAVLGIKEHQRFELQENTVVLNRTMAKQLAVESNLENYTSVIGKEIEVEGFFYKRVFKITGVIPDQFHFGVNNTSEPVIYLHIGAQNPLYSHRLAPYIFVQTADIDLLESKLNDWAEIQSSQLSYDGGKLLSNEILDSEPSGKLLFFTSGVLAVFILLVAIVTLHYRFEYIIKSQRTKWAILVALGGKKSSLIIDMVKENAILAMLASITSIILVVALQEKISDYIGISVQNWSVVLLSSTIGIVLVAVTSAIVARRVLSESISGLLRY